MNLANYKMTDEPPAGACPSAHTPVIFPDGRVSACIGPVIDLKVKHPLLLGNLREESLARILDAAETNAVLHIIRVWGPSKLLEMIQASGYAGRLPARFVDGSICHLCYSILSDAGLREAAAELARDRQLLERTAYGRQYYLNETSMLEAIGPGGAQSERPAVRAV
ncbi:MAG: SPASM domain-containing protein [Bryobacterales bacterium]|nr:SPASM domain-containing protein [Bryobacterales bacterium]